MNIWIIFASKYYLSVTSYTQNCYLLNLYFRYNYIKINLQ